MEVRKELHKFFYSQGLFKLNRKADATEAFFYLLSFLHYEVANSIGGTPEPAHPYNLDRPCNPKCYIHEHFQLNLV